jgi:iron complex transport system substrate-binding protein
MTRAHVHIIRGVFAVALAVNACALAPARAADATRIVSVGGAVTEILYALGLDANIVGIDSTSLYPPRAAREKPSVGYMRQLSAEGVLGLRPSLILVIAGAGPQDTLAVLEAAKVPLVTVPDIYSEAGIVAKVTLIAQATGAGARAPCIVDAVHADFAALDRIKAGIARKKRVLFVLSFVNGRALVSGGGTAADGIIRLAGAVNAIDDYAGYKPISDEAIIAARPDVILTMQRNGPGVVSADDVFTRAAFAATPAAAQRAFVSMEGLYLLGFGPRTARAARDLAATLYPELKVAPLPSEHTTAKADACPA